MGYSGQTVNDIGTVGNDLAEFWAGWKGFVAFALNFAAMAADTFLSILKQVVVAHNLSPHRTGFRKRRTRARGFTLPGLRDYVQACYPTLPIFLNNP